MRLHERFATLDAVCRGRAEVTVGRGSFTESFPLFGSEVADYEVLFEEKLDLLAALRAEGFEQDVDSGALHVGSPDTVAVKAAEAIRALGLQRFSLKYSVGGMPEDRLRHAVRLYGTGVAPRVRELLADASTH